MVRVWGPISRDPDSYPLIEVGDGRVDGNACGTALSLYGGDMVASLSYVLLVQGSPE